jgi:hypothetical protein
VPKTGDACERNATYVDEHGHEVLVSEGALFPPCEEGDTWWWHEELPVAVHMRWEAARRAEIKRWKEGPNAKPSGKGPS